MIKHAFKFIAKSIAPQWSKNYELKKWYGIKAAAFRDELSSCTTIEEKVTLAKNHSPYYANQQDIEITELCQRLSQLQPRQLCEIGAFFGGTLALFAQVAAPDARLYSIDLKYCEEAAGFPRFALPDQEVFLLPGDSHDKATVQQLSANLGNDRLDFLFIDGDHTLRGVTQDFYLYAPFVRPGGIIAFHDIVPDSFLRTGKRTATDVGEVPLFWNQVKAAGYKTHDLIKDPDQDGMGIGVIEWDGQLRKLTQ